MSQTDRDAIFRGAYRIKLLKPSAWKKKAEELIAVAESLEPTVLGHPETSAFLALNAVYLMLASFAVENLRKGALVARNRKRYEEGMLQAPARRFPEELKSHDLLKLGALLELVFSEEETRLAKRLSHAAAWSGRYPVPLRFWRMPIWDNDNSLTIGTALLTDVFDVHRLLRRLEEELDPRDPAGADLI
jgi:hypothetical protein